MIVALLLCLFGEEPEFKNLKVLPTDITKDELMSIMSSWSNDLGVNCKHCHWGPTELFDDLVYDKDEKQAKKKAREMFRMMTKINESFFTTNDIKISCYTCHHGTKDPRSLDEILSEAMAEGGVEKVEQTYRKIRKKYHGLGSYNFGPWVALNTIANQAANLGDAQSAKRLHELNLEFNPEYDGSHFALGAFYITSEPNQEKAWHHMKRSMQGNSFWTPRRLINLAGQLEEQGNSQQLMQVLTILTTLAPENADGHYLHGNALKASGDLDAAEKAYQHALEIDPEHAEAEEALEKLK